MSDDGHNVLLLCKDCRHIESGNRKCMHPEAAHVSRDFYDGELRTLRPTIEVARMIGACGTEGKLWEPT